MPTILQKQQVDRGFGGFVNPRRRGPLPSYFGNKMNVDYFIAFSLVFSTSVFALFSFYLTRNEIKKSSATLQRHFV